MPAGSEAFDGLMEHYQAEHSAGPGLHTVSEVCGEGDALQRAGYEVTANGIAGRELCQAKARTI